MNSYTNHITTQASITMYIYFRSIHSVLTCEEYPQIVSVEEMKSKQLEAMCNKWEKRECGDGNFTLSFRYTKHTCTCDCDNNNSSYVDLPDYHTYECYHCGIPKTSAFKEGDNLYLQNSGHMDIVCVKSNPNPNPLFCQLSQVDGYPNVYQWANKDTINNTIKDDARIYALHINNNRLSDENVVKEINVIKDSCHITFTNDV